MSDPKDPKVLALKNEPLLVIPFFVLVAGILVAAGMQKITPSLAGVLLALLGFPSIIGAKTAPDLLKGLLGQLMEHMATMTTTTTTAVTPDAAVTSTTITTTAAPASITEPAPTTPDIPVSLTPGSLPPPPMLPSTTGKETLVAGRKG